MRDYAPIAAVCAISYLLGSIPFGYILIRLFRGTDIRESGSKSIGATNVARTAPALGIATLILDAAKGAAAVLISSSIFFRLPVSHGRSGQDPESIAA